MAYVSFRHMREKIYIGRSKRSEITNLGMSSAPSPKETDEIIVAATLSHLKRHRGGSRDVFYLHEKVASKTIPEHANTELVETAPEYDVESEVDQSQADDSTEIEPAKASETGRTESETPDAETSDVEASEPESAETGVSKDTSLEAACEETVGPAEPPAADRSGAIAPANVPQRPRKQWKNVLLTATSMVLTKDARKKVRQVLALLRLASEQLNTKVNALRVAMEEDADLDNVTPKISHLAIRNDIITTIKKCMAMFSTLATNSLPSAARARVRNTILKLPARWASQLDESNARFDRKHESAVLAVATETLVAIRNITNILSESMDKADSWVEKLPNFSLGKRRRIEDESEGPKKAPRTDEEKKEMKETKEATKEETDI